MCNLSSLADPWAHCPLHPYSPACRPSPLPSPWLSRAPCSGKTAPASVPQAMSFLPTWFLASGLGVTWNTAPSTPPPSCPLSTSLEPSHSVGPWENLMCACLPHSPTRACAPWGSDYKGRAERDHITSQSSPTPPLIHSPQILFAELTSSEIFTARTWFAKVRTRPLEMSFSMVSWGGGECGLRLGISHIIRPHTVVCDSQPPPGSPDSLLCLQSPNGWGEEKGLQGRPGPTDKPRKVQQSWSPFQRRASHLAMAVDVVLHQLL